MAQSLPAAPSVAPVLAVGDRCRSPSRSPLWGDRERERERERVAIFLIRRIITAFSSRPLAPVWWWWSTDIARTTSKAWPASPQPPPLFRLCYIEDQLFPTTILSYPILSSPNFSVDDGPARQMRQVGPLVDDSTDPCKRRSIVAPTLLCLSSTPRVLSKLSGRTSDCKSSNPE
ncbi:hypothetical protein LY76DRAFT_593921 [Colletotrichum caudatum]|nr:hypothetical protein LY76DRAFT_593921 [Colletotrichum caudatum]